MPHTHFTNRITSNNTTQAPTVKAVYDYILENGGGGGGGTGTGGSGIKEKVDNPKLWELTSGMYEVTSGFYYTVDNYQSLENTSAILFIGDDSPEQDINYFMVAGRVKYYGVMKIDGSDGTIVTEDFSNEEISESSTNKDIPSSKAVYDFVTNETEAKVSTNPNIWELEKGWHYIQEGFYLGRDEGEYVKIEDSALIYKTGDPTTICQFYGIGCVYPEQINLIRGEVLEAATYCDITRFTEKIDNENPLKYNYPSEKAVVDFVQGQLNSLIDTAPDKLNTLNELANALNNDENFASTVMEQIGKKIDKEAITTEIYGNSTDEEIASAKAVYDFVNNNTNKRELLETNTSLIDLDTGIYETSYMKPIILTVSEEKEIILSSSTIYNQKDEIKDEEGNFIGYIYQGIIVGTYSIDDGHNGVIFYCLTLNVDNEINISEFTDLNDDFIKRENITKEISINSNHLQIPTAKAVYEFVSNNTAGSSREQLKTNTSLLDLNTGVYEVSYINPIILTISDEKEIILSTGTIFNQKDEAKDKDGNFFGYISQGIIIGTYSTDDGYSGVIYYCATINTEGVVTITEFTDLNEDFIKEENITKEISSSSTHLQIPTAKAVYENLEQKSQVQIIIWEEND